MAKISYARRAIYDLKRVSEFLFQSDPKASYETTDLILDAIRILQRHPQVGRPKGIGLRELVIREATQAMSLCTTIILTMTRY
jgi:plasmid stabilization system protein ParE